MGERRIALEGAQNFRDLGGYRTADGRQVAWGLVYRSDHLALLTGTDLERLDQLGVKVVVDYRNPYEHEMSPSTIVEGGVIRRLDRPIGDGSAAAGSFRDLIESGRLTTFEAADLTRFYLETLERSSGIFAEVLGLIADPSNHAFVFHCTAGKDRTGLTAALLLGALGVDDATILDDYELTNEYRSARRVEELRGELAGRGIDIERIMPLFQAPREAMAATLVGLHERYGSIEDYLRTEAGLDRSTLDDLRRTLLVEPA
jgi:protein-tyrosine phosphatase